jgi:long-subunit fatty acid transport protein
MKKSILITLITLLTIGLNAQSLLPIKYGIKAGVNIANIISTPIDGVKNITTSSKIGITGGFYMEIALNDKWYINPELLYSQEGASFNYDYTHDYNTNSRDEYTTTNDLSLSYVKLNPTVSYKASDKLSLNLGPSVAFLMSSNYLYTQNPTNQHTLSDGILYEESLDVGLNFGISYYINENLLIDSKLYTGFMNIGKISRPIDLKEDPTPNAPAYTLINRAIVLSLAYLF